MAENKWVTAAITLLIEVLTPFITGRHLLSYCQSNDDLGLNNHLPSIVFTVGFISPEVIKDP